MAFKDDWKDLEDAVAGVENSGSDIIVEPINAIAHEVINIDENLGNIDKALDGIIAIQNELIGGDDE